MNRTTTPPDGQTKFVILPPPPGGPIDTSRQAAASLPPIWLTGVRQRVYDLIAAAGADGRTADECEAQLGLRQPTAAARCNELMRAGLIQRSGRRRPTRSGRSAHVLCLPQFGEVADDQ